MPSEDREILRRIEQKLDEMSEKVTILAVREETMTESLKEQKEDVAKLKAAYYKAVGILTFVTFPGVATTLWLGFQLYMKKP
jgi:hypothetical protein